MTTSGQHHQVIPIRLSTSVTHKVHQNRLAARAGEGPTLSPNPTPPSPVRCLAGALLQSRADARVGDESQGIAVKGLRCPLGYPRSDLGHLRMIAHRNGTMPRWPAPGTVRPGARAPSCGSLGEAAFGHSSLNLAPGLAARAQPAGTSRQRALPRAVAVSQRAVRRRFRRARAALCICVRACMHVCVRACVHAVMILPQVHLRKPCYDFYFL